MGQVNIGLGNYDKPTRGTHGYGFTSQGKPIYIDSNGVAHELFNDLSIDGLFPNIIANAGVGLEENAPVAAAGYVYVTSDTFKIYTGIADGVYDITDLNVSQFVTDTYSYPFPVWQYTGVILLPVGSGSGGGGALTDVVETDQDVNPAVLSTLYRMDCVASPRTVYLPDPSAEIEGRQIGVELHKDTHKVSVTTVSSLPTAIDGNETDVITRISAVIRYQCDGTQWLRVLDTRNMRTRVAIVGDRDFSDGDGFEHAVLYEIFGNSNIILPAPRNYNDDSICEASFVLKSAGVATFSRIDEGLIGDKIVQTISTINKGFTIAESNSEYTFTQDSRPTAVNLVGLEYYRLTEASLVAGFLRLTREKTDPDYSPTTVEQQTADISSETPSLFIKYIADEEDVPRYIPATNIIATVTTRKTLSVQANVSAYYVYRKRNLAGDETFIVQSAPFVISSTVYEQRNINIAFPETTLIAGETLTFEVWLAKTAGSGVPTLTTKFEGTDPARFAISVPASSVDHNLFIGREAVGCHPASAISVTAPTGYTSTDQQSLANELAENTLKGNTTYKTTPVDADSTGIWDSVANAFKRVTFANLKAYVLALLGTDDVLNESTLAGTTLTVTLNAAESVAETTIQDTDEVSVYRSAEGNMIVPWSVMKADVGTGVNGYIFVANQAELDAALALERESVSIYITVPITGASLSNIYPKNVLINGEMISFAGLMFPNIVNYSSVNITFLNKIYIERDIATYECNIFVTLNGNFVMNFRDLTAGNVINISQSGSATLVINVDNAPSVLATGGAAANVNRQALYSTGLYANYNIKSGYNIIESQITKSGNVTITAYLTFEKLTSGSIVLLPQDANVMLNLQKINIVFLGSDQPQTGLTYMVSLITIPRFDGESVALSHSVTGSSKGEHYIYKPSLGDGSIAYLQSIYEDIDMSAGDLILNYENTQTDTNNRCWYAIEIKGTASIKQANWITIP